MRTMVLEYLHRNPKVVSQFCSEIFQHHGSHLGTFKVINKLCVSLFRWPHDGHKANGISSWCAMKLPWRNEKSHPFQIQHISRLSQIFENYDNYMVDVKNSPDIFSGPRDPWWCWTLGGIIDSELTWKKIWKIGPFKGFRLQQPAIMNSVTTWDHDQIHPNILLVGGLNPSEKYESQLGWLFPIASIHFLVGGLNPSEKYESQLGWWHSQYMGI